MSGRRSDRALIVVVVVLSLVLGGCQVFGGKPDDPMQELREQVRATVADPGRQDRMLASIERIDGQLEEVAVHFANVMEQKRALFENYDSTREEFEVLLNDGSRERQRLQRSLLEKHIEFKSFLTEEEWDVILPVHVQAVAARTEQLVAAALER